MKKVLVKCCVQHVIKHWIQWTVEIADQAGSVGTGSGSSKASILWTVQTLFMDSKAHDGGNW
jgi:hypothetical protein